MGGAADILLESAASNQSTRLSHICTMSTVIPRKCCMGQDKKTISIITLCSLFLAYSYGALCIIP